MKVTDRETDDTRQANCRSHRKLYWRRFLYHKLSLMDFLDLFGNVSGAQVFAAWSIHKHVLCRRARVQRSIIWSGCPSRSCIQCIVSKRVNNILKPFHHLVDPPFSSLYTKPYGNGGVECRWVWKNSWFSINISFYLENDRSESHSYYGTPTSNGTIFNELEWAWVT